MHYHNQGVPDWLYPYAKRRISRVYSRLKKYGKKWQIEALDGLKQTTLTPLLRNTQGQFIKEWGAYNPHKDEIGIRIIHKNVCKLGLYHPKSIDYAALHALGHRFVHLHKIEGHFTDKRWQTSPHSRVNPLEVLPELYTRSILLKYKQQGFDWTLGTIHKISAFESWVADNLPKNPNLLWELLTQ